MPRTEDLIRTEEALPAIPSGTARLGPSFAASGEIAGTEDLVLQGKFKGAIKLPNASLYVDRSADIEAEVQAANVYVFGRMAGSIEAKGRVFLAAASSMTGDVTASRLSVQDGAKFRGSVKMDKGGAA
jgi:cytoskeletal protein CcmA (bactofilin family)